MQTIGVFFGSRSPEHDISVITGVFIIAELKKLGYSVVPVYIGKTGEWYISDTVGSLKFFTQKNYEAELAKNNFQKYFLDLESSRGKIVFKRKGLAGREITIDVAFPALHGSFGEDGTIQGLFEMLGVPYVGCDVTASAVTMDKVLTKLLYQSLEIPTTKFVHFTKNDWENDKNSILKSINQTLTYPVFVKPARLGSSIGIAKVSKPAVISDLETKIEVALHYDTKALVEEGVDPVVDLTCALIGNESVTPSLLQESVFASDLFNFEEKYLTDGGTQLGASKRGIVTPARLESDISESIQNLAVKIYRDFGCAGIARVDFLYNRTTKQFFANEINTLPGTLYHHLWKASGKEISVVLQELIALALERQAQAKTRTFTFASSVLEQAGSLKIPGNKL
ncbi:MAG: D-alanine--D-alanine ligase family protein [Candidatus Magasanikbacteria bacterium]|nr:D-alanine--D-alanine ligase family protein [Candidatus Magasanikbacteria bacterium]